MTIGEKSCVNKNFRSGSNFFWTIIRNFLNLRIYYIDICPICRKIEKTDKPSKTKKPRLSLLLESNTFLININNL